MGATSGSGVDCTQIPGILLNGGGKGCELVAQQFSGCMCEKHLVQPDLSPGIVEDPEILVRFVIEGHRDKATNLTTTALFSQAGRDGMSITRCGKTTLEALIDQQNARNYVGYVTAKCEDVRSLKLHEKQTFAVYDTAIKENTAHSDVCQALFPTPKSKLSGMRHDLRKAFELIVRRFEAE